MTKIDVHKVVYVRVETERHESVRVKAKHTMQKNYYDLNNDPLQAHGCQSLGRVDGR